MNSNSSKSVCNAMSIIEFAKSLRKYDRIEVSYYWLKNSALNSHLHSHAINLSIVLAMV